MGETPILIAVQFVWVALMLVLLALLVVWLVRRMRRSAADRAADLASSERARHELETSRAGREAEGLSGSRAHTLGQAGKWGA